MTETNETPVAPAPITPAVPRRTVGADAEAALRERHQKAQGEELFYAFRGQDYRITVPVPAAVLIHAGLTQVRDGDMEELMKSVKSAFVGEDGEKLWGALLDTSVPIPADFQFINEMLNQVAEAATGRPSTN